MTAGCGVRVWRFLPPLLLFSLLSGWHHFGNGAGRDGTESGRCSPLAHINMVTYPGIDLGVRVRVLEGVGMQSEHDARERVASDQTDAAPSRPTLYERDSSANSYGCVTSINRTNECTRLKRL
ncbi:hypothetical protein GGS23DRAFT_240379 [Durotheca rogersii]|uniref:uncharacterized protein n=1 Tax=Durotheca rogersii TaxID=419775 RepID=UPI00221FB6BC|nr:uncharacterized protein GGS23DRAFT_240379 [Durotheca rogersii]KAI5860222.1 hypothetical protein GGS23DRAFT_240379 [Durotheca rogersii]